MGSGSHAVQTAEVMRRFEPVLEGEQPAAVLVVGDVNSTMACALVAAKHGVPVIHVEAGLRSYDRTMPEEINRVLTDQISDLLFITESERAAPTCCARASAECAHPVRRQRDDRHPAPQPGARRPRRQNPERRWCGGFLAARGYARADPAPALQRGRSRHAAQRCSKRVGEINRSLPVVFPLHPRTRAKIEKFGLEATARSSRACCSCRRWAIWRCSA